VQDGTNRPESAGDGDSQVEVPCRSFEMHVVEEKRGGADDSEGKSRGLKGFRELAEDSGEVRAKPVYIVQARYSCRRRAAVSA